MFADFNLNLISFVLPAGHFHFRQLWLLFFVKARTEREPNVHFFFFWNDSSQTGETRSEMKLQIFMFPLTRSKIVQSYVNKK